MGGLHRGHVTAWTEVYLDEEYLCAKKVSHLLSSGILTYVLIVSRVFVYGRYVFRRRCVQKVN